MPTATCDGKVKPAFSAHYISGTHWDREWYRPFQEFRLLFVELVDGLLDLMEKKPEFRYFHFDGQTCVLEDYLEIRPEQRDRLARLILEGRILIGPWYTMPDLFCPGAEALIRNLLQGRRVCRHWGVDPMPVAYTCDMFGHPSQMPQIYHGFDLPHCVLGRGTNEHTTPAFFRWEAPDGTGVFCFKLQDRSGYGAFVGARREFEKGTSDPEGETRALESLKQYIGHEIGRCNGDTLCLIDALDHMPPAGDAPRYIRAAEAACPEVSVTHSTLPAFFAEAEAGALDVPTRKGELREPARTRNGYLWLIPNCPSSRVRMKQANDACQCLFERWVEPWLAFAAVSGHDIPRGFLEVAWKHVLLNHAHDSICGCSIDQVHRDMMYRFDQARLLGEQLRNHAFGLLTAECSDLATAEHEFTLTLANPVPCRRTEVVVFHVNFPADWPRRFQEGFRSQPVNAFRLYDDTGREIPYQLLDIEPGIGTRTEFARMGIGEGGHAATRYTVAAELTLPGTGFTSLRVSPADMPVRRFERLRTGPLTADNGILALEIMPNGTIQIRDGRSGETYRDLLLVEDCAEIGDGWFHGPSVSDETALSGGCQAQISVVHDGPEMVTFRIALELDLPKRYDWPHERRSPERCRLGIVHLVSLRRGATRVEVTTVVDNDAEDHRLRMLFPADVPEASTYIAHHPFDLVVRPIARDPETVDWSEPDWPEKPFLDLQAVGCGQRGLAFLSGGGLHEGGVADDTRRTMQVTLLRSFRRTVGTPGEQDGLEPGKITFRYALMPYSGEFPAAEALHQTAALQAGLLSRQTGRTASGYPAMAGNAHPRRSFLEQQDRTLAISAVKQAENGNGCIVRLWNPDGETRTDCLAFGRTPLDVRTVKMHEEGEDPLGGAALLAEQVRVTLGPHRIGTLRITF